MKSLQMKDYLESLSIYFSLLHALQSNKYMLDLI